jgi:uncharacterized tellurite resistance protein B-like protein
MLDQLNRKERRRLLKFVCSFAWADLEVQPEEREFVEVMVKRLAMDDEDQAAVQGWLERPPEPESVDPTAVPPAHRQIFLDAVRGVIEADGKIAPEEHESFRIFEDLIG